MTLRLTFIMLATFLLHGCVATSGIEDPLEKRSASDYVGSCQAQLVQLQGTDQTDCGADCTYTIEGVLRVDPALLEEGFTPEVRIWPHDERPRVRRHPWTQGVPRPYAEGKPYVLVDFEWKGQLDGNRYAGSRLELRLRGGVQVLRTYRPYYVSASEFVREEGSYECFAPGTYAVEAWVDFMEKTADRGYTSRDLIGPEVAFSVPTDAQWSRVVLAVLRAHPDEYPAVRLFHRHADGDGTWRIASLEEGMPRDEGFEHVVDFEFDLANLIGDECAALEVYFEIEGDHTTLVGSPDAPLSIPTDCAPTAQQ